MNLNLSVEEIPRVSSAYSKRLNKLGIKTIRDLIYHFPFRYDDLSKIAKIADIKINETITIHGEIINIKTIRTFKKKMFITEALIKDDTGTTRAVWYNQPFLMRTYKKGAWVSLAGKPTYDGKTLFFSNPAYEKIFPLFQRGAGGDFYQQGTSEELKHTGRLVPVYPETARLTSKWLRYILKLVLPKALPSFEDFLPVEIKKSQKLIDLKTAIEKIHSPKNEKDIEQARHRLGFDELFLIHLSLLEQKNKWQKQSAPKIEFSQPLIKKFAGSLPFKLTNSQKKAAWEILQDLEKPKPMNRLLEGDVGSGKTVVAVMAALQCVDAGYQTVFMAPTEILAQQHFKEITKLLSEHDIATGLLTSNEAVIARSKRSLVSIGTSSAILEESNGIATPRLCGARNDKLSKKEITDKIRQGQINIIIGTHAVIQENIKFNNLALAIVDEQHRFGVNQRAALQKKIQEAEDGLPTTIPHLLSMTATPIPRTLALTIYGNLDLSILKEMPKGRQKIITKIVAPTNRQKAYDFIRQQIKNGRQIFVICPRIEKSESNNSSSRGAPSLSSGDVAIPSTGNPARLLRHYTPRNDMKNIWADVKAVEEEYEKLSKKIFPDLKIAMLHGRLKPKEKEKIMTAFRDKKYDILVSTSVIEVGVDVPNASVMMIESADRFGLAQLHQFRGRVGRSEHQSYCFLFTESSSRLTNARLKALLTAKSGFELAEKDLEIRGPGEFYGTRQWGLPDLTMASLTDVELINSCRQEAEKLLNNDSDLNEYPLLKEKLNQFQTTLHLE